MAGLFDLSGRLALVTGGGSGLGLAIARGLGEAGARVILSGRRAERLQVARASLVSAGIEAHAIAFDVTDAQAVDAAVARIEREIGGIAILVNNAGMNRRAPLDAFTDGQWRELMAANLDGPFHVTRACIPSMKARRAGKVINVCSLGSDLGRPNVVPYAVSKGGLKQLTRGLAVELAPSNIQVNGIVPGFFRTDINAGLVDDPQFSAWVERRTPAGRWADPPEIAGAAVFLASRASDYVTGHLLHVDGGFAAAY